MRLPIAYECQSWNLHWKNEKAFIGIGVWVIWYVYEALRCYTTLQTTYDSRINCFHDKMLIISWKNICHSEPQGTNVCIKP